MVSAASGIFPLDFHTKWLSLRRLAQNSGREISVRHFPFKCPRKLALVKCPYAFRLRRLAPNEKSRTDSLPRDLLWRSCSETLPGDLFQKSCHQSSFRDLELKSSQETSHGDLVQRPGVESRGLARRSYSDSLNRDLALRSPTKIFCGDLL